MPRSITAWLIASVSVAFSAVRPSQMNNLLIARNIMFSVLSLLRLHSRRTPRLLILKQDLALEDKFQLRVQLLLVRRRQDGCPLPFHRREHLRIHIKRHKMEEYFAAALARHF